MILFLYKGGRRGTPAVPQGPEEFFYGAAGLVRAGYPVDMLDAEAIASLAGVRSADAPAGALWRALRVPIAAALPGFPLVVASHLLHPKVCERLSRADTIVATTTGFAYALAGLKATGRLRARTVALAMGILADSRATMQRALFARLLRHVELVAFSEAEAGFLRARLPGHPAIARISFGVDAGFWRPGVEAPTASPPYVLAVGNDGNRDWATLVAAWSEDLPKLRIVTRLPLPALPANVEAVAGSWHGGGLSDAALRTQIREAALVVVPVRPTIQPSGQSACLQAMACGRPVVVTDFEGLWDRDKLRHAETCYLVPPCDPAALAATVREALKSPRAEEIGRAARDTVERGLTSDHMAAALGAVLAPMGDQREDAAS